MCIVLHVLSFAPGMSSNLRRRRMHQNDHLCVGTTTYASEASWINPSYILYQLYIRDGVNPSYIGTPSVTMFIQTFVLGGIQARTNVLGILCVRLRSIWY